jgi:hypothetical protein
MADQTNPPKEPPKELTPNQIAEAILAEQASKNQIGEIPGRRPTSLSEVARRAEGYLQTPEEDLSGFWKALVGQSVPRSRLALLAQMFNPVAFFTSTPTGIAARLEAADALEEGRKSTVDEAKITGLVPESELQADPDKVETIIPEEAEGQTGNVQKRARKIVAGVKEQYAQGREKVVKAKNESAAAAGVLGGASKAVQGAGAGALLYNFWPQGVWPRDPAPTLKDKLEDSTKLEGDRWNAVMQRLEPLRVKAIEGDTVELANKREESRKLASKALSSALKVNIEGLKESDLAAVVKSSGVRSDLNAKFVQSIPPEKIDSWMQDRSAASRRSLNEAMDAQSKIEGKKDMVYLGRGRFAIKMKGLEGENPGWTIASLKDGKVVIPNENSDLDNKPTKGMTYGEYKKLKGSDKALAEYSGNGGPEIEF